MWLARFAHFYNDSGPFSALQSSTLQKKINAKKKINEVSCSGQPAADLAILPRSHPTAVVRVLAEVSLRVVTCKCMCPDPPARATVVASILHSESRAQAD